MQPSGALPDPAKVGSSAPFDSRMPTPARARDLKPLFGDPVVEPMWSPPMPQKQSSEGCVVQWGTVDLGRPGSPSASPPSGDTDATGDSMLGALDMRQRHPQQALEPIEEEEVEWSPTSCKASVEFARLHLWDPAVQEEELEWTTSNLNASVKFARQQMRDATVQEVRAYADRRSTLSPLEPRQCAERPESRPSEFVGFQEEYDGEDGNISSAAPEPPIEAEPCPMFASSTAGAACVVDSGSGPGGAEELLSAMAAQMLQLRQFVREEFSRVVERVDRLEHDVLGSSCEPAQPRKCVDCQEARQLLESVGAAMASEELPLVAGVAVASAALPPASLAEAFEALRPHMAKLALQVAEARLERCREELAAELAQALEMQLEPPVALEVAGPPHASVLGASRGGVGRAREEQQHQALGLGMPECRPLPPVGQDFVQAAQAGEEDDVGEVAEEASLRR